MYHQIKVCRICGNTRLIPLFNLGEQALTGVFPKSTSETLTSGPLALVKCYTSDARTDACGLVQLQHAYSLEEMYGDNYGYRSGLNKSMVIHLQGIVTEILERVDLKPNDIVLDIGSNDSTTLQAYPTDKKLQLIGIDPIGKKFKKYYPSYIQLIADFFSAEVFKQHFPAQKAKVITSIAMFYDLEQPFEFVKQIGEILADDGIWVFEQSYLPSMLATYSYDTICHEHLEYYALTQIKWMLERASFKLLDVELNKTNGGSFKVTASKQNSTFEPYHQRIDALLSNEIENLQLHTLQPFEHFVQSIEQHRKELKAFVAQINAEGKKIFGYGASTKGNVLLQYCGFTSQDFPYIAEVNEDKFGSFTPFTHIPIIDEKIARAMRPDYFLVLPWHFRENILEREKEYISQGGKFVFPLPKIEIVG